MMRANAEFAGIIVAVGFLLMGLVTMPVLILAAVPLGIAVALPLRFTRKVSGPPKRWPSMVQ